MNRAPSIREELESEHRKIQNPLGTSCQFSTENLRRLAVYAKEILEPDQILEQVFLLEGDKLTSDVNLSLWLRRPITEALLEAGIPRTEIGSNTEHSKINFGFNSASTIESSIRERLRTAGITLNQDLRTFSVYLWKRKE